MNKFLLISLGVLASSDILYSMIPVYSAQASADFNANQNGQSSDGNQNGNYQNSTGNNNYTPSNNDSNNNMQGGYNQPTTLTTGNNGNYSANNAGQNGYNQNNNGYSNNGAPNNNYNNGYNNSGSNTNNQNNNNQNGNNGFNAQMNNGQPNAFTENYALKGKQFKATVYRKDVNGRLYKTTLSSGDLQKAIIIFFGDWCPHCSRFLSNFSKNIPALTQAGVKIIFIGVPSIDRLQNWQEPTDTDFNDHLQKLNGFGIQTGNNSELVLLGDKDSLNNNAVDSLPTMMAVSNGRECFRGGADNSIERVEFTNQDAIGQFLQVFNSFGSPQNGSTFIVNNSSQQSHHNNNYKANKTRNVNNSSYYGKVNADRTNMFTEMLNNDCNWACAVRKWAPPTVSTTSSCPPCPACPVCPKCSAHAMQVQTTQNPIQVQEISGNYSNVREETDTCTTCACKWKRAFKKRCGPIRQTPQCRTKKCCKK